MKVVGAAIALAVSACSPTPIGEDAQAAATLADLPRSRIVLMSSLPLVYGDSADINAVIAGQGDPHPLYSALNAAHDLVVADTLDTETVANADLALLIQPRALPPQALVALDDYVRSGGRLLLFTDPQLEWPSRLGLGDPRGPLRSGLLSPLLRHWGLELVDPETATVTLPQAGVQLHFPGQFTPILGKTGDARCALSEQGHVARCQPGKGRAILVADADLLNRAQHSDPAGSVNASERFVAGLLRDLLIGETS